MVSAPLCAQGWNASSLSASSVLLGCLFSKHQNIHIYITLTHMYVSFLNDIFTYYIYKIENVGVCMGCTCVAPIRRSDDSFGELALSFYYMVPRNQIQVVRFGG